MPTKASFMRPLLSRDGKRKRITLEKQTSALRSGSGNLGVLLSGKDGVTYKKPPESAGQSSYLPRHQPLLFEFDRLPFSFSSQDLLETAMGHVCFQDSVVLQSELPRAHMPPTSPKPAQCSRCPEKVWERRSPHTCFGGDAQYGDLLSLLAPELL